MHPAYLHIGARVHWTDPDQDRTSGDGTVAHIGGFTKGEPLDEPPDNDTIIGLQMDDGGEAEVLAPELDSQAPMMTHEAVIRHLCETVATVYRTIGDYAHESDGFCHRCPPQTDPNAWNFRHRGLTLEYVRVAVLEKLTRDGLKPSPQWKEAPCDTSPPA